jgi:adenylate kinase family enzyme
MTDAVFIAPGIESANRIHIIGGPGSGKSTLANQLGEALDLPVHALDNLAYEGPEFNPRPREYSAEHALELAAQPQWITEGVFLGWTDPLLQRADVIIWVDYLSWRSAAARITLRTLGHALGEIKIRRGRERFLRISDYARNLRQLVFVIVASRDYWFKREGARRYPVTRWQVEEALSSYGPKVVHLTRKRDARRLETWPQASQPTDCSQPALPD